MIQRMQASTPQEQKTKTQKKNGKRKRKIALKHVTLVVTTMFHAFKQ